MNRRQFLKTTGAIALAPILPKTTAATTLAALTPKILQAHFSAQPTKPTQQGLVWLGSLTEKVISTYKIGSKNHPATEWDLDHIQQLLREELQISPPPLYPFMQQTVQYIQDQHLDLEVCPTFFEPDYPIVLVIGPQPRFGMWRNGPYSHVWQDPDDSYMKITVELIQRYQQGKIPRLGFLTHSEFFISAAPPPLKTIHLNKGERAAVIYPSGTVYWHPINRNDRQAVDLSSYNRL